MVAKKEKKPKPRLRRLPHTEDGAITEIERAANDYVETRDERMTLTKEEQKKKAALLDTMKKHRRERYVFAGREIVVVHEPGTDDVKVRTIKTVVAKKKGDE